MPEAQTTLTTPLDVRVNDQQISSLLGDESAAHPRLLVVEEIREDESGAALHFQQGLEGRLNLGETNYAACLRVARRSRERQHPVGVKFGEPPTVVEVLRADNDLPMQLWEEDSGHAKVLFQGHDGVFRLQANHSEFRRIRALLEEAIRRQARVWFIAHKPDLALLDVLPAGWAAEQVHISFVVAPDHLLKIAAEILQARIRCTKALRSDIRAVAKAYIDEADELKRAVREIETNAANIQIESRSPAEIIEKAKSLRAVQFPNKELQENVRAVANSYVLIAEKNQQLFEEFKEKYREMLAATK